MHARHAHNNFSQPGIRGHRMHRFIFNKYNYLRSLRNDFKICKIQCGRFHVRHRQMLGRLKLTVCIMILAFVTSTILAQGKSPIPLKRTGSVNVPVLPVPQQVPTGQTKRSITVADAVSIFLQQNLQLVAARYDIDTAEAEKLSARLRPNPEITIGSSGLPINFSGPFIGQQTFAYNISQDLELGGKRKKRIDVANANAEVAQAQFQTVVWQLTNDVKKKFYAVLLAQSLLDLAKENEKTFADIVDRTTQVFKSGEISGLDLQRLEVEKFKFDTDLANSERDYELALRDLRPEGQQLRRTVRLGILADFVVVLVDHRHEAGRNRRIEHPVEIVQHVGRDPVRLVHVFEAEQVDAHVPEAGSLDLRELGKPEGRIRAAIPDAVIAEHIHAAPHPGRGRESRVVRRGQRRTCQRERHQKRAEDRQQRAAKEKGHAAI